MTETVRFDSALSAGARSRVGHVGVHAGIACIAVDGAFPGAGDDSWLPRSSGPAWGGPGWVCSTSGIGDGDYEVLDVRRGDHRVGVEIVFLSASVAAREQELLAAVAAPRPSEADYAASRSSDPSPAVKERIAAYWQACSSAGAQAHEELSLTVDPASDSSPTLIGTLTVSGGGVLGIGDPCFDDPAVTLAVLPGRYAVVAWLSDLGDWGVRTARLGAYRTGA